MDRLKHFRFWCQKVLPLVYDNSLSYYEVLCKVVDFLNHMRDDINQIAGEWEALEAELAIIKEWIDNFDTKEIERIIEESFLKMVIVGLDDNGYLVFYVPNTWDDITFNTTGYDINVPTMPEYGHLVLSY